MDEIFSSRSKAALEEHFDVVWGRDGKIPADVYDDALPGVFAIVAANPVLDSSSLKRAKNLRAVVELSGSFPDTIDYAACAERGVEVLSCSPGFRRAVAEMGLAMLLAGARGLVREHEAFRAGEERWLDDVTDADFTLHGANIGFVGFGRIARELAGLLAPFKPVIRVYDPWLPANTPGVESCSLEELAENSRALVVMAVPTSENLNLIDAGVLGRMADNSMLVLLSRAHLVDFEALAVELDRGRIMFATDVFPEEPVPLPDPIRKRGNVILSPHRAAAVAGGRQLIGEMVVDDLMSIDGGSPERRLVQADSARISMLAGVGDASKAGELRQ